MQKQKITSDLDTGVCVSEANYANEMENVVLPYVKKFLTDGFFKSHEDKYNLYYKKFELDNPKAKIIFLHGLSQNTQRYEELIYYFLKQNYSCYIYDQRCHGRSDRLTDDHDMIYVDDFNDYVLDLKKFIENFVVNNDQEKLFLFGHSMGGAVIAKFLQEYQDKIKMAVLAQPMLKLIVPEECKDIDLDEHDQKTYGPGQGKFNIQSRLNDRYYKKYPRFIYAINRDMKTPEIITGGTSYGWLNQALKITQDIMREENLAKIKTPIYLFQSEHDQWVLAEAQDKFASQVKNCQVFFMPDYLHTVTYLDNNKLSNFVSKLLELCEKHLD